MSWNEDHSQYQCVDGTHNSFWKTVTESPEWAVWEQEIARRMKLVVSDSDLRRAEELRRRREHEPELTDWPDLQFQLWDVDECAEAGWISPEHFADFLTFVRDGKPIGGE